MAEKKNTIIEQARELLSDDSIPFRDQKEYHRFGDRSVRPKDRLLVWSDGQKMMITISGIDTHTGEGSNTTIEFDKLQSPQICNALRLLALAIEMGDQKP